MLDIGTPQTLNRATLKPWTRLAETWGSGFRVAFRDEGLGLRLLRQRFMGDDLLATARLGSGETGANHYHTEDI